MPKLDIAVCGCGLTGLASAILLSRAGHRVRLLDQFEAPRSVGSGLILQPPGLAVLDDLGAGDEIRRLGCRIERAFGRAAPSGRIVLDIAYAALGEGQYGIAIHRGALFATLFQAAVREGIPVEPGVAIADLDRASDSRPVLVTRDGRRLGGFDLVIDALGARSPIVRRCFNDPGLAPPARQRVDGISAGGLPLGDRPFGALAYGALWATLPWTGAPFAANTLEQRYERASTMIGVLPIGRKSAAADEEATLFWSLKPADYEAWRSGGLDHWKERVERLWPETRTLLAYIRDPEQLILARYGHHTLARPIAERIAVVGDAAHATSPQLGQGANMGLLDALALARAFEETTDIAAALARYARLRRRHVRLYQAMSWLFTPFYQSDSRFLPALRDRLMAPVSRLPGMDRLLVSLVAGQWGRPLNGLAVDGRGREHHSTRKRATSVRA